VKRLWSGLGTPGRIALVLGLASSAIALVLTARNDLQDRDSAAIRGNPEVWKRVTRFPGGAAVYLIAGRRLHPETNAV
jgi:hypothetical protein